MRALSLITLLAALILPIGALAEVQTITAMHTYMMGDPFVFSAASHS